MHGVRIARNSRAAARLRAHAREKETGKRQRPNGRATGSPAPDSIAPSLLLSAASPMATPLSIPVLDLRLSEEALSPQLRAACESVGFFFVEHTGVEELQAKALAESRRFFALPLQDKLPLKATVESNNRGYTVLGEETLDPCSQSRGGADAQRRFSFL
jgi:non-haem dioxygenase in morphine synthesis N-terminal